MWIPLFCAAAGWSILQGCNFGPLLSSPNNYGKLYTPPSPTHDHHHTLQFPPSPLYEGTSAQSKALENVWALPILKGVPICIGAETRLQSSLVLKSSQFLWTSFVLTHVNYCWYTLFSYWYELRLKFCFINIEYCWYPFVLLTSIYRCQVLLEITIVIIIIHVTIIWSRPD